MNRENNPETDRIELSVLIPAYNEGTIIADNLREVLRVLQDSGFSSFEVVLVDDASIDDTYQEALRVSEEDSRVRAVRAKFNGGKGHALRLGFEQSRGEKIVFLDADLDLPAEQIRTFYDYMANTGADVVAGSKRHPESEIHYPESRKLLSWLFGTTVRKMFRLPISDTQTGLKLYKREVLSEVFAKVVCLKFAFDLELLALANKAGFKLVEHPVILRFRRKMRFGRVRSKDFAVTAWDTLRIFFRVKFR